MAVNSADVQGWGKMYGIGVGPGDPQLLTLRACDVLRQAPVVCVPRSTPGEMGYTWEIIRSHLDASRQEILHLHFPMTRDARELETSWGRAVDVAAERLAQGKDCAFVTEGDPLLYSTFVHVLRQLNRRYPQVEVQIVPGVSSILAAAATARVPLADGDDCVAVLPATGSQEMLELALSRFDTVVLIKVSRAVGRVLDILNKLHLEDKAVFISRASSSREEVVGQVANLRGRDLEYMSLIIVRK